MSMVALEGLRPWVLQRLSAVYLVAYVIYALIYWLSFEQATYANWHGWVSQDHNQVLLGLFYLATFIHAWIGVRDILLDYIKPFLLRLLLLFAVAVFLIGSGFWLIKILIVVNA